MRYLEHFGIFRKFRDILKCLGFFLKFYDAVILRGFLSFSCIKLPVQRFPASTIYPIIARSEQED